MGFSPAVLGSLFVCACSACGNPESSPNPNQARLRPFTVTLVSGGAHTPQIASLWLLLYPQDQLVTVNTRFISPKQLPALLKGLDSLDLDVVDSRGMTPERVRAMLLLFQRYADKQRSLDIRLHLPRSWGINKRQAALRGFTARPPSPSSGNPGGAIPNLWQGLITLP
jgi:hypothetical protein